jgi:hypothetical protein
LSARTQLLVAGFLIGRLLASPPDPWLRVIPAKPRGG